MVRPRPADVQQAAASIVAAFARTDTDAYFAQFAPEATFVFHSEPEVLPTGRATSGCGPTEWSRAGGSSSARAPTAQSPSSKAAPSSPTTSAPWRRPRRAQRSHGTRPASARPSSSRSTAGASWRSTSTSLQRRLGHQTSRRPPVRPPRQEHPHDRRPHRPHRPRLRPPWQRLEPSLGAARDQRRPRGCDPRLPAAAAHPAHLAGGEPRRHDDAHRHPVRAGRDLADVPRHDRRGYPRRGSSSRRSATSAPAPGSRRWR